MSLIHISNVGFFGGTTINPLYIPYLVSTQYASGESNTNTLSSLSIIGYSGSVE
jgi:hypothetical protein